MIIKIDTATKKGTLESQTQPTVQDFQTAENILTDLLLQVTAKKLTKNKPIPYEV